MAANYEQFYRRLLAVVSVLMAVVAAVAGLGAGVLIWAALSNPQWGLLDEAAVVLMAGVLAALAAATGWFALEVRRL